MSREIKFRAWDKKHRKYTKVLKIYFGSDGSNLGALVEDYETNYAFELQANQVKFEQYTGLKDRNGEGIYEGDIVTMEYDLDDLEPDDYYVITFKDGCFRVGNDYENEAGIYLSDWCVIGNIHENPELIDCQSDG